MLRFLLTVTLLFTAIPQLTAQQVGDNLIGRELTEHVRSNFRPTTPLSYKGARERMFSVIDNRNGKVRCVYTGVEIATIGIPNGDIMNTEHTWPQSKFDERTPMKVDLHHLFPTLNKPNGVRSNLQFGEIPDSDTTGWWRSNTKQLQKPTPAEIDEFSESFATKFEPREDHKGNFARAMFYFWIVYRNDDIEPGFMDPQLDTLLKWHADDPVSAEERARNAQIKALQGNDNPFVLDPTLALRIVQASPEASPSVVIPAPHVVPTVAPIRMAVCPHSGVCTHRMRRFRRSR